MKTALTMRSAKWFSMPRIWDAPPPYEAAEQVVGADIENFAGCLARIDEHREWALIYNETIQSSGRRRFTQAHALGH